VTHPLRHGAFVPQGWKLEFAGVPAAEAWHQAREIALLAEQIGYDHLWVYDHVETVPRRGRVVPELARSVCRPGMNSSSSRTASCTACPETP